jgi:DNA-binding IclR family transcriptional regulator
MASTINPARLCDPHSRGATGNALTVEISTGRGAPLNASAMARAGIAWLTEQAASAVDRLAVQCEVESHLLGFLADA